MTSDIGTAEALIERHGIVDLPVDPFLIAKREGIAVGAMPESSDGGVSGMLMRVGTQLGILYPTHIDSEGFRRFCVAHELGHVFLPGHQNAMSNGFTHESLALHQSDKKVEREADRFAAELLMPRDLFEREMRSTTAEGVEAIEALSSACGTSLTATAFRYLQRTRDPVAIVLSKADGTVLFADRSKSFREYPGARMPSYGTTLRSEVTGRFLLEPENVSLGNRASEHVLFRDWFDGPVDGELVEEVIGLGMWGRCLTVLTPYSMPMPEDIVGVVLNLSSSR